jgi:hypothetical protein
MLIDDPGEVLAVLTDDGCPVPPVPPAGGTGVAWLRACVVRFSSGAEHRRRRALVEARLARVEPAALRGPEPAVALAEALGLHGIRAATVASVAAVYQPVYEPTPEADAAVAELVAACGGVADEDAAATICLLVQAHQATLDLIAGALRGGITVAETLRTDPPVRRTRRLRGGRVVEVDLTTRPFGAGPHACPGRAHAIALAENVVAACSTTGMDPRVQEALAAIGRQDWDAVKRVLHPYLHWTDADGTLRGRTKVLAHLAGRPAPAPPADYELRDGQIYRWAG